MSSVTLTWSASARATSYTVYRSTFAGANGSIIAFPLVTSYVDTTVVNGTSYWYSVSASNIAGESPLSAQAPVTIPIIPPPPTPQTITSFTVSPTSITVGAAVTITWATANATQVKLNGSPVASSGTTTDSPASNKSYTLTVSGSVSDISQVVSVSVTAQPQAITSFTATPSSITAGQSSNIAWATTNASAVTLNGVGVIANGFIIDSPPTTKIYTLTASGSAPDVSHVLTVTVSPVPPPTPQSITSFTVTPSAITAGQTVTISWATANSTQVKLNNVVVASSGSTTDTPSANKSYTLLVSGSVADISQTKGVTVTQPAQTITSFTALPATVSSGQTVTITWSTANSTQVKLNGVVMAASGSTTDAPTSNKTYTLLVSGSAPDISQSKSVTIQSSAQTITSFSAAPAFIQIGGSSTLTWSTLNATGATLNGNSVGTSGSLVVSPTVTTNYTLTITGSAAPVSSTISVAVQSTTVLYIPPETSFTNQYGTWTMVGGEAKLNGVGTGSFGDLLELVNGTVFLRAGSSYFQYFSNNYFGTGFAPVSIITSDPANIILAPSLPYIGPSNTPNNWTLELTGWPAIDARVGHVVNHNVNPNNAEFGTDGYGINYMRFTNDPRYFNTIFDGTVLLSWFIPLGASFTDGKLSQNMRWLLWIESDVFPSMDEIGMKLPGLTNDNPGGTVGDPVKWRNFHIFPMGNTVTSSSFPECAENAIPTAPWYGGSGGAPIIYNHYNGNLIQLKPNCWNVMEERIVLNTPGVSDGYGALWLNGNKVLERTDILWRNDPTAKLVSAFVNVYHGGLRSPSGLMHYRIAKIATSTSYIGVPAQLLSGYPAWRGAGAGWEVGTLHSIAGTAQLNGDMPQVAFSYPATVGRSSADVETWNGFASDGNGLWGVALGGHSSQWSNKTFYCDLSVASPSFNMRYRGSDPAPVPYDSTTGTYPIPSAAAANTQYYYNDGLPCSRHTYYANIYIAARNRVFMFYDGSNFGSAPTDSDNVDAFNITGNVYDAAGAWASSHAYSTIAANQPRLTAAKHPTTEDVYMSSLGVNFKWTQTTATWSQFSTTGAALSGWQSTGTVIDGSRNRWVAFPRTTPVMEYIDLATMVAGTLNITDPTGQFAADIALSQFTGIATVHDLDNDRYLLFLGLTDTVTIYAPGKIYSINPTTGAASLLASVEPPVNGWMTRVHYMQSLGGVVFLPSYASNLQFLVTR